MLRQFVKTCCLLLFSGMLLATFSTARAASFEPAPVESKLSVGGDLSTQFLNTTSETGDVLCNEAPTPPFHPFHGIEQTTALATGLVINYAIMQHLLIGLMYSHMDTHWDHDSALNSADDSYYYGGYTIFSALHFTATWLFASHMLAGYDGSFYLGAGAGAGWADTSHFDVWQNTAGAFVPLNSHDADTAFTYFVALGYLLHVSTSSIVQFGARYTDWGRYKLATNRPVGTTPASSMMSPPKARFYGFAPFITFLVKLPV